MVCKLVRFFIIIRKEDLKISYLLTFNGKSIYFCIIFASMRRKKTKKEFFELEVFDAGAKGKSLASIRSLILSGKNGQLKRRREGPIKLGLL